MHPNGKWTRADLSDIAGGAAAAGSPAAYTTNFPGQGPVAHVVYRGTDQHIHELFVVA
ncbi:MAG TPA: hypothetical protein VGO80_24285 [Solirubrobacteraceae bacterium]|nr:hypothetical protein [Solirubrobacteraceae bacterium]